MGSFEEEFDGDFDPMEEDGGVQLSGSLLLAHPNLSDPNFAQSVILLSAHSEDNGALGVILNRPSGKTLGELFPGHGLDRLSAVEVFEGGPVQQDQLILAAWKWDETGKLFNMFFGISREKAEDLMDSDASITIRGFMGYAGWSAGQLEDELTVESWIRRPITLSIFEKPHDSDLWADLIVDTTLGEAEDVLVREDPMAQLPDPPDRVDWN